MPRPHSPRRDFPGKRGVNLALRTGHLAGVVLLGAALLGTGSVRHGAVLCAVTGLVMFAIDSWAQPGHWREVAGCGILLKLALVGLMAWQTDIAVPLFWLVLVLSTILSHAPGELRHRRLI